MTPEFESETENGPLKRLLIDRIARDGAVSFRDYMATVLYHPEFGYYTGEREKMGRDGDYLTSPELTPLFGAMIGRQLREMWEVLGRPAGFTVVEAGAGNGTLARDVLGWARRMDAGFAAALRYVIVEVSGALAARQRRRLAAEGLAEAVEWAGSLPAVVEGCILANELLDALPVHRVVVEHGSLREVYVGWDGIRFQEELRDPAPAVTEYFARLGLLPGERCSAEVNLAARDWVSDAARALERGFLLLFDYGYEAEELYAPWRRDGTLLCFYRHNPSNDPYARVGRQDITAHVDFTTVRRAGEEAGLTTLGLVTQSEFLANLGIGEAMARTEESGLEEYFARRRAVTELLDPGGLGRIKVLVQGRGAGGVSLRGLSCA